MTLWTDDRLERALTDLALAIDTPDQVDAVRARLTSSTRSDRRGRVLVMTAAVLLAGALLAAIPGSRQVAADWLGIGATSVEEVEELPAISSTTEPTIGEVVELSAAERRLALRQAGYPDLLPSTLAASPATVVVEDGQARVVWADVELTIRPLEADTAINRKFTTSNLVVEFPRLADGSAALWVPPGHVILRGTAAQAADGVLLWAANDHEYRLEGATDLATAVAIADSMG